MLTKELNDFLNHGNRLDCSNWSAWFAAYRYAESIGSPLLPLIDKGCDYAEQQRHVPKKYLDAAERLFRQAMDSVATLGR
jgi:hypothetical protein